MSTYDFRGLKCPIPVLKAFKKIRQNKIILDPVMVAKGGFKLIDNRAINVLRNKLFLNKHGYSFWKQERNYSFDEDDLREIVKKEIFTIQNLTENQIDKIIDKTNIEIDIVHPKPEKDIRCKGNIAQVILD